MKQHLAWNGFTFLWILLLFFWPLNKYACLALWQRVLARYPWNQGQKQGYQFHSLLQVSSSHLWASACFWSSLSDCLLWRLQAPASYAETTASQRLFNQPLQLHKPSPCNRSIGSASLIDLYGHCFDHDGTDKVSPVTWLLSPPHIQRKIKGSTGDYWNGLGI